MFEDKIEIMNQQPNVLDCGSSYEKRVYTVEEIMDILNIGKNTAYTLVNSGAFHFVKVGGHYRISKKSFDRWLDNIDSENSGCQVCD
jgi:excisionase family DNA binding protein